MDKQKIEKLGGVMKGIPPKIYIKDKIPPGPALTVTRVVGNLAARPLGITYKPDIQVHNLTSSNKLIILGTNGFW